MLRLFVKRGVNGDAPSGVAPEVRWFIAMRWKAVLAGALLSFGAAANDVLPVGVGARLLLALAGLGGLNASFAILARYDAWRPHLLLAIQVYADLAILTVVLHFTGGVENPLSLSLLIHVVFGGILLSRRQCYMVATVASVLFMLMAWGEWSGMLHHYFVPALPHGEKGWKADAAQDTLYVAGVTSLQSTLFFFVAYVVTTLVEGARFQEHRLEALAEEAHAERRLLEQALQTTGTALRVTSPNLRHRWMNGRWREWFGSGDVGDSLLGHGTDGRSSRFAKGGEAPSATQGSREQVPFDGTQDRLRVTELALPFLRDDGPGNPRVGRRERVFRITTAPLINRDGTVGDVVELAQEITQEKQAEAHVMRAAKLAAVGRLAGNVAHEVNNPIAIISAKARLLLGGHRDGMSAKTAEEIGKIVELADRVARIAQGLLSYCRPSPARRIPMDIRVPIRKALSMVEQRTRTNGVRVEDRLGNSIPAVRANASEIEEVFLNLFLNALDAMPASGVLSISTSSMAHPNDCLCPVPCVEVVVEDTGSGIPEEIRGEIFEPFFTTKEEARGTGLGLAICLGIIRNHGGTIDADSEPGRWTRFTVRLPIAGSDNAADTRHG